MNAGTINIRILKRQDYLACWQAMQTFTQQRTEQSHDEIWLLEHEPIFTQGQNGKSEHLLKNSDIPLVYTDRGGQITYHGPGQLMMYTLIDLKRKGLNIRQFVNLLEASVIDLLAQYQVNAYAKRKAPGVYISSNQSPEEKICSVGLRVKRGSAYHGIALNVNMDLQPFTFINPCGFSGLKITQCANLGIHADIYTLGEYLAKYLFEKLGYTTANRYEIEKEYNVAI